MAHSFIELNRLLMRLVLRQQGSPNYAWVEGMLSLKVQESIGKYLRRRFSRVDEDDLAEVFFVLMCRWRDGRLTGFSELYVKRVLFDQWRKNRPRELDPGKDLPAPGRTPLEQAEMNENLREYREQAERFRDSLDEEHRFVFECWIEDGKWGWKGRAAEKRGKPSQSWVTRQFTEIESGLADEFGVNGKDATEAFAELFRSVQKNEAVTEPAPAAEEVEAPNEDEQGTPSCSEILRERLLGSFAVGTRERTFMGEMAWRPDQDISTRYPDENAILDCLHRLYVEIGKQYRAEKKAERETGRLSAPR